jgi:hypothetical protein
LLIVTVRDTEDGLLTMVQDLTTGQTGFMTASVANGFAQIAFDPEAKTCTSRPYAYHPMYATSNEHTRVPWAAHSFNGAFSDEIGHYNYCDKQDNSIIPGFGACLNRPAEAETDPKTGQHNEAGDLACVDTASSVMFGSNAPWADASIPMSFSTASPITMPGRARLRMPTGFPQCPARFASPA